MEDKLESARKILLHPNFKKLSPVQIQDVYKTLLSSGLSKDNISNILRSSSSVSISKSQEVTYLESLPYNVFMNLIMSGEIQGKDLISLCNSSPLINEKCNKAFIGKNGENVPQFIFYALLKKLGINLTGRNDYRNLYVKVSQNLPFLTLKRKLDLVFKQISNLTNRTMIIPRNINDLLYHNLFSGDLGLIISKEKIYSLIDSNIIYSTIANYNRMQILIHNLEIMEDRAFYLNVKYDRILTSEKAAELANISVEDFLEHVMDYGSDNGPMEDYINVNEKFRLALNDLWNGQFSGKLNLSDIGRNWSNFVNHVITLIMEAGVAGLADPNLEAENVRILESVKTLTSDELEYLTYLHRKVLSGELPVLTPLEFEELIKY
jgi:hypothetical protein